MTFPASHNINYYLGDTHEFNVYPKDKSGQPFSLSGYDDVEFVIAARRGAALSSDPSPVLGYSSISSDGTHVECAITPTNAAGLQDLESYVYDVRVSRTNSPYNSIFTLLTGNISVQNRVPSVDEATTVLPEAVTAIVEEAITDSSIQISWTAPTTGGTVENYRVYAFPYLETYADFTNNSLSDLVLAALQTDGASTTETSYTITQTSTVLSEGITSEALQPSTQYLYMVVSSNSVGKSDPNGNFDLVAATISPTTTAGGA